MTTNKRRFLALFLTLCLGISLIPGGLFLSPAKAETYGIVINGSIKLRREASTKSATWFTLPVGWICEIHSEKNAGGIHWYRVIAPIRTRRIRRPPAPTGAIFPTIISVP
jgi:hypothetical protein